MKTDFLIWCGGRGPTSLPHAQHFSLDSMTSQNLIVVTKSCIPLIQSQIFLQSRAVPCCGSKPALVGCAERSAWCGFKRMAAFKSGPPFQMSMPNLGNISREVRTQSPSLKSWSCLVCCSDVRLKLWVTLLTCSFLLISTKIKWRANHQPSTSP